MTPDQILASLDPDQQAFILATPAARMFLSASAGSGKSRCVVHKVAHLVSQGYAPESITTVSFTRRAANVLKERLAALLDPYAAARVTAATLHSLCFQILKETGVFGPLQVVEGRRRSGIMAGLMKSRPDLKIEGGPGKVLWLIGRERAHMRRPGEAQAGPGLKETDLPDFAMLYHAYDEHLEREHLVDFDAMQSRLRDALDRVPGLEAFLRSRIMWLLVDEFQDLTPEQRHICERLCGGALVGVGDGRQSLFGFRSADYEGNMAWARAASLYTLGRNYRATATLVRRMNALIELQRDPLSPQMVPTRGEGPEPTILCAATGMEEAHAIASAVERLLVTGTPPSEIAIIYRLHALGGPVELALLRKGIPYRVAGRHAFYDLPPVRQALAYLRLTRGDDDEALEQIYNLPRRYLGTVFWQAYVALREEGKNTLDALMMLTQRHRGARALGADLRNLRRLSALSPARLLKVVEDLVGQGKDPPTFATAETSVEADDHRQTTLEVLREVAEAFSTVEDLLEAATSAAGHGGEDEGRGDQVTLMSGHRAKSSEFDHVFSPGWTSKCYPFHKGDPAEELRVAFVIGTRARQTLHLSWPASRGRPSPYLWRDLLPEGAEVKEPTAAPALRSRTFDAEAGQDLLGRLAGLSAQEALLEALPGKDDDEADEVMEAFPALADENVVRAGLEREAIRMPDLDRSMNLFRKMMAENLAQLRRDEREGRED